MPHPLVLLFSSLLLSLCCSISSGQTDPDKPVNGANSKNAFAELNKARFDANKDGKVGKWELPQRLRKNFSQIDKDGDGFLDDDELIQFGKLYKGAFQSKDAQPNPNSTPVPDSVVRIADIAYREGKSKHWKLDLVHPKDASPTSLPAIVFIHGGGWQSGDKGQGAWRDMPIAYAQKGYVCISVNYRLTNEAPFPACIEDCQCAVRWLRANAKKYNVNPDRIGAYGNSAGAHLAAMLGVDDSPAELEGHHPHADYSGSVAAVCCVATPTNFLKWTGESDETRLVAAMPRLFGKGPVDKLIEVARHASPITHINKDPVPFLVMHGTADKTVPVFQGDCFVKALKAAGGDVTYLRVEGSGHGVYGKNKDETRPKMEAFFKRTLAPQEP